MSLFGLTRHLFNLILLRFTKNLEKTQIQKIRMIFQNLNQLIVNHDENLEKPNKSLIAGCVVAQWQFLFDKVQKLLGLFAV